MKNKYIIVSLFTVCSLFLSKSSVAEAVIDNEHQQVIDTAHKYFRGVAEGDQALLAEAFDMEFGHIKMITVDQDTKKEGMRSVSLKEFAGYFKKATKETWKAKVLSVDIVDEKMAMVKLDFDTPKNHYVDYLVMYKRDGRWKIINKTFVANQK